MEFYSIYQRELDIFQNRFNSQRDGILPDFSKYSDMTDRVSIPNGMEFYISSGRKNSFDPSFNSQRDGILRGSKPDDTGVSEFQFPTGWNSTPGEVIEKYNFQVSIPNGMEFYLSQLFSIRIQRASFNSQRDGILPKQISEYKNGRLSFNSQRDGILLVVASSFKLIISSFNSQRDGILPSEKLSTKSFKDLFQFPTGWNSTQ